jgi:hypothetical protein
LAPGTATSQAEALSTDPIATIKSIDLTDGGDISTVGRMDKQEQKAEIQASGEPSDHECECPDPCNCDHENE